MVWWSVQGQQGQVRNKTIIGLKLNNKHIETTIKWLEIRL